MKTTKKPMKDDCGCEKMKCGGPVKKKCGGPVKKSCGGAVKKRK